MAKRKAQRKDLCTLNKLRNEKGLTLIELLACLILFSIIAIFVFNLIVKATSDTSNIRLETELRDEADLLVSQFMKELYGLQNEAIIYVTTNATGTYLEVTTNLLKCLKKENGQLENEQACKQTLIKYGLVKDPVTQRLHLQLGTSSPYVPREAIEILPTSTITAKQNNRIYELKLDLRITKKQRNQSVEKTLSFSNTVSPISK